MTRGVSLEHRYRGDGWSGDLGKETRHDLLGCRLEVEGSGLLEHGTLVWDQQAILPRIDRWRRWHCCFDAMETGPEDPE